MIERLRAVLGATLLGGQVDILCDQTTQTLPHIKAGTVKPKARRPWRPTSSVPRCAPR